MRSNGFFPCFFRNEYTETPKTKREPKRSSYREPYVVDPPRYSEYSRRSRSPLPRGRQSYSGSQSYEPYTRFRSPSPYFNDDDPYTYTARSRSTRQADEYVTREPRSSYRSYSREKKVRFASPAPEPRVRADRSYSPVSERRSSGGQRYETRAPRGFKDSPTPSYERDRRPYASSPYSCFERERAPYGPTFSQNERSWESRAPYTSRAYESAGRPHIVTREPGVVRDGFSSMSRAARRALNGGRYSGFWP